MKNLVISIFGWLVIAASVVIVTIGMMSGTGTTHNLSMTVLAGSTMISGAILVAAGTIGGQARGKRGTPTQQAPAQQPPAYQVPAQQVPSNLPPAPTYPQTPPQG